MVLIPSLDRLEKLFSHRRHIRHKNEKTEMIVTSPFFVPYVLFVAKYFAILSRI
jgi:hypothetical protein